MILRQMSSLFLKIPILYSCLLFLLIRLSEGQADFWTSEDNATQIEEEFRIDDVTKILKRLGNYNRNAYPLLDEGRFCFQDFPKP